MSEMRVALYAYEKSEVTITPNGPIDFYRMGDDYSAELLMSLSAPTTLGLVPGVYGFAYTDKHGIEANPTSSLTLVVDVQRKQPWPKPPPPPPSPFVARRDWSEHTTQFMSPLAFGDEGEGASGPAAPAPGATSG